MLVKADFHLHTSEDREDRVAHSAHELIKYAAKTGFNAISITNHNTFTFSRDLENFAADLGVLLIPGIEKKVEGKHVLILNAYPATERIKTFAELLNAKNDGVFVIAPHPFFKTSECLGNKLLENLDLFDALEFSFCYSKWFNLNKQTLRLAEEKALPVVGNSDCHVLKYMGVCHSVLQATDLTLEGVFSAIHSEQVQVVSQPLSLAILARILFEMKFKKYKLFLQRRNGPVFLSQRKGKEVCIQG
ncbi:PHP domain-containing protein [candidate division KSB1 bacterium]|nr:PHP domain-containing protein [candidate division KSB1 bacterium]NIR72324.1 PHP domain-containing protein [candidate division KSB1 bacterium]NIS26716.1 PHP domain-containing protein [candidate division KSB1 bacterium]NIT73462.1 PHP domain-containing protein [candidate division KSB1 bacterium]NIU27331.1 PHP domain-containing protein [candidate division KSB1 bacterium]